MPTFVFDGCILLHSRQKIHSLGVLKMFTNESFEFTQFLLELLALQVDEVRHLLIGKGFVLEESHLAAEVVDHDVEPEVQNVHLVRDAAAIFIFAGPRRLDAGLLGVARRFLSSA